MSQVSLTLAKSTKPKALQNSIQRKDETNILTCILFTSSPFLFKRRDYLKSVASLMPCLLLRLPMAQQLGRQFLRHVTDETTLRYEIWLLQEMKAHPQMILGSV